MQARIGAWSAFLTAVIGAAAHGQPPSVPPETNLCSEPSSPVGLGSAQWNGWGRDIENTRYQPEPALRATDVPKLGLKWAFGYQGSAVAGQPTVVDGRLFVLSATGRVYSLDARTGCGYWTFDASAGTHSGIFVGELGLSRRAAAPPPEKRTKANGKKAKHSLTLAHLDVLKAPSAVFFGDDAGAVYALDAQRGTLLWKTPADAHPLARISGAPTLFHDRVYVAVNSSEEDVAQESNYACCTFRGSVAALDMSTGRILWKTFVAPEEPRPSAGAAIAASPTIDSKRNVLYVGTGAALTPGGQRLTDAVVALDLTDGQVRWSRQFSRHDTAGAAEFVSAPILRTLSDGKQILLAGQKSGIVFALDPDRNGELLWQTKGTEAQSPGVSNGVLPPTIEVFTSRCRVWRRSPRTAPAHSKRST